MKKRIRLKHGEIIINIENEEYIPFTSILRAYFSEENGELEKIITFSIWDDISFNAYTRNNTNELDFVFNSDDPIYLCLNELLEDKENIIIYDDMTISNNKNMIIKKEDDSVKIVFVGDGYTKLLQDKFNIFIKNIGPDARSKINNVNFKFKLVDFFRNCERTLLEDNYIVPDKGYKKISKKKGKYSYMGGK